ncbi:membrane protein [Gordonia phage Clown]|uniref:Membrane protein n=1 Tax=Gordonia phage Clown TaxID=2759393 RepID=A0A7L7SIL3_9CAUD|nr:membrane protein [Gordonia phage Clown]QOC56091.1 membrane protein [Gordonia phage Clown]
MKRSEYPQTAAVAFASFCGLAALLGGVLSNIDPAAAIVSLVLAAVIVLPVGIAAAHRLSRRRGAEEARRIAARADEQNQRWNEQGDLW